MSNLKYERPDFVKSFNKPKNTEIKHINGHWYLYEKINYYDKELKRSKTKSGSMLGTITENGFVPKKTKTKKENTQQKNDVVEAGATRYFYERTEKIRERLKKHFPDIWEIIYTIVLLRLTQDTRFRRLQLHYEDSILSYIYPDISLTKSSISDFLNRLGHRRESIRDFMQEDMMQGDSFILCDGHRLLSASKTMENAELGYDSKMRYKPQINVLYMFTLGENTGAPAFYKQYLGSTPDTVAFHDIIHESEAYENNCTLVADKAFSSQGDIEDIEKCGLLYILPLKRGNKYVKDKIPDVRGYEEAFSYHGRGIQSISFTENENYNIHLFFDSHLYSNELSDLTKRTEKKNVNTAYKKQVEEKRRNNGKGRLSDSELASLVPINIQDEIKKSPEMGTITIKTNRKDLNAFQVYSIFKQRQIIEQAFKTNDCTLDQEASFMRNNYTEEAWLFLNHLGLMITIESIEEIANIGRSKSISFKDLVQSLKKIKANRVNGHWSVVPVKQSVSKLCNDMNIDISDLSCFAVCNELHTP